MLIRKCLKKSVSKYCKNVVNKKGKDNVMQKSWVGRVLNGVGGKAALMLLAAGMLVGQSATAALTGIASTKHNLGSTGTGENHLAAGSTAVGAGEICVFCHTPHGADAGAAVPLWNKNISSGITTYTTYNSLGTSSLDGATVPVGSVSIACLSCHDGTQAMSVMINQPGSGGYTNGGADFAGASATWTGARQSSGKLTGIANLGSDLSNDHPIGIQYGGGPASGETVSLTTYKFKDADFQPIAGATINDKSVWWVNTTQSGVTTSTGREKTDMQLYTRRNAVSSGTTLSGDQPFVECASCHDPHSTNVTFLRIDNTGSAVCLACHIK
jgi:predicted CXXCH cytochrome family protein